MISVGLSDKVLAICEANYKTCWKGNGCGRCPIRNECITNRPVRSLVEIEEWQQRLNDAAEKVA